MKLKAETIVAAVVASVVAGLILDVLRRGSNNVG